MLEAEANVGRDHRRDRAYEVLGLVRGGHQGEGQLEGIRIVKTPVEQRTQSQKARLLVYFIRRGSIINEERFKHLQLKEVGQKLDELEKGCPPLPRAPTMQESPSPRVTRIHVRGNFRDLRIEVSIPAAQAEVYKHSVFCALPFWPTMQSSRIRPASRHKTPQSRVSLVSL